MSTQRDKAEALRALHRPGEPLVLVNVWDAASARVVAAAPGCQAVATASHSIAAAHGFADGEAMPRETMLAAIGIIAGAVELPVTADLERGYGDAGEIVALAIEAGAVGCNLEDSEPDGTLRAAEEHAARVAAARANGEELGVPVVINARTDVYIRDVPEPERLVAAIERAEAYMDAGADCIFVPGLRDLDAIREIAARVPVSVLAGAGGPARAELAAAGVSRISYGPGPMGVAAAALRRAAEMLLAGGEPPADLAFRP
ncbi:isocitrate lyase/PEP mutase family protein [Candidatus Solirubrobacter pratensis]|uniref:isocitrate lyase/PEP mutase family protein n=1 Tax=Candidatus Solirubrobacter pratensis TaxID=1298857 RepID=UPI0004251514|nr:isocitrate lyase/phosphoenolpyruvate mutase family protein [Candidatus Solirubrobacter pratensis]